ncbi:MAG: tetratricopeptide repeat protein [Gemmatimonadetes bacterium]|nr:tetratricopeptide repeat protein [Gemmatimonadota bacterium]
MTGYGLLFSRVTVVILLTALPFVGCGRSDNEGGPAEENQAGSLPLTEEAQLLVDQGNAAQREGRYSDALEAFGGAMEIHPNHPVPQFGSLMAAMALGDTALVESLKVKLQTTGPELLEMLGPSGAMGGTAPGMPGAGHTPQGSMPPGHPSIQEPPVDTTGSNPVVRG